MEVQKKFLLFDFDGTIADSLPVAISVFNELAPKHNYAPVNKSEIDILRGKSAREIVHGLGIAKLKLPLVYKDGMQEFAKQIENIQMFSGMKAVIDELATVYSLGIVTSNARENVELFLKKNELSNFEFIYSDKSIFGKGKIIRNLLKKYHIAPENVLYIGDEVRDIEAARSAHIKIVSVCWGFNTRNVIEKSHPDYLAGTPQDLLTLLIPKSDTITENER